MEVFYKKIAITSDLKTHPDFTEFVICISEDGKLSKNRLAGFDDGCFLWYNPCDSKITHWLKEVPNPKELIQRRTKVEFYHKLQKKLDKVLHGELDIEEWANEVFYEIREQESELENFKLGMDITTDEEWDEDEPWNKNDNDDTK